MTTLTEDHVREALKQVIDPELFVNIVDLGLIYTVDILPAAEPTANAAPTPAPEITDPPAPADLGLGTPSASDPAAINPAAVGPAGEPSDTSASGRPTAGTSFQAPFVGNPESSATADATKDSASAKVPSDATPVTGENADPLAHAFAPSTVRIEMTMTSPACPAGPQLLANSKQVVSRLAGVQDVEVKLVMDPPWTPDRMTEDAKDQLGIF